MIKKLIRLLLVVILLFSSIFLYGFLYENHHLTISRYAIDANINSDIRIVQLTDLHNAEFGSHNSALIEMVQEQNPDLIVITGDMINKEEKDISVILDLIKELSRVCDVYYGFGNHEVAWNKNNGNQLAEKLENAGAIVVNTAYKDIEVKNVPIRIAGYMGYYGTPHMTTNDSTQQEVENSFMREFENTDRYKILLDHIPTSWVDWKYMDKYPVDLVLCGHYHGGLIRIPFINRGLYAPYVGKFPKNIKGKYEGKYGTCILSAGLGNEHMIPRINNPPEIVVVDLVSK